MKKSLLFSTWLFSAFAVSFLFLSFKNVDTGKKQQRAFKANADTWYRISPTVPSPINVEGSSYLTFAYVPGGGEGNATHMGKVKTYFNQLAYTSNLNVQVPAPEGSITASVADVINYPVLNLPLPFIQNGDFDGLVFIMNNLNIPASINGKLVSSFFYNEKGDAVFISNSSASIIVNVSPTRNEFSGKALIVGGRGKFANAAGEVDFKGSFNPANPNEADYEVDGWISY
jgi:hypothetical protein